MNKTKKNITILAIGDRVDYDSFKKFHKEKHLFLKSGFDYVNVNYKQFLDGRIPQIRTKKVIIFLFFPFFYWDRYIEYKDYKGIYGNRAFYKKFIRFWEIVTRTFNKHLSDKDILFINNPLLCGLYRDKLAAIKKMSQYHLHNPKLYKISRIKEIEKLLDRGHNFFIKPRYGSMGKGITYLSWPNWQTNFIFKNNKIINRLSDHGWRFKDITGNHAFLRQLIKKDVLIQKAVDLLILNKKKVDLRVYTFFNKVIYIYPRKNHPDKITTNISQGGRGDPGLLEILPKHLLKKARKITVKMAKTLKLNFAGIDIILDRNLKDVYVIDVNTFPGFPKRRTFNLARCMLSELSRLSNKGGLRFKKGYNIYKAGTEK